MNAVSGAGRWVRETAGVVHAIFRSPPLRRVLLAYLLYTSALYGTWVAILLYAYDALGPSSVGLAAVVQLLPAALFAAVAASLADRYPRRRMLPLGYLAQGAAFGAAGTGMLTGAPVWIVLAALAAAASALTLTRPTQGALLLELSRTPVEATAANALVGMVEGAGVLLGPLVAAGILLVRPPGSVLLAGAGAGLLAAALVIRLPAAPPRTPAVTPDPGATGAPPRASATPASRSPLDRMRGGLRALAGSADTRLVVMLLGLRMLLSGALDILIVLLALEVLGLGNSGAGALSASFGLGTVLGGAASVALVGRRRLSMALAASAVLVGLPLVLLGAGRPAAVAPVLLVVTGTGYAIVDVAGRTILQRVADPQRLATVLGSLEGVGLIALATGSLLAPMLVGAAGVETALVAAGLLLPGAVVVAWVRLRRIDRLAMVPLREIALLQANPIFAPLSAPQLETAAGRMRWLTRGLGAVVIREGDVGDRYYVLAEGSLRVTQGGRFLRMVDRPGDGVGEIALLRGIPRTATVTVGTPAVLLTLGRDDFLSTVTGSAPAQEAGRRVAADLSALDERVESGQLRDLEPT